MKRSTPIHDFTLSYQSSSQRDASIYPETVPAEFRAGIAVLKMSNEASEEASSLNEIETDYVIVATGFHADLGLLEQAGVAFIGDERIPCYNPEIMETNVPGIFLAGTRGKRGETKLQGFH